MKRIFAFFLVFATIYLSSCSDGANDSLPAVPKADSISKGSYIQVSYTNDSGTFSSFNIQDLVKSNVAYYSLFAEVKYNPTDSLWHCRLQVVDVKQKHMGLIIYLENTSSTGTFTVTDNSSALVAYSNGENNTYAVLVGSTVEITKSSYPIEGALNLQLYRNHFSTTATGLFKIYF